MFRKLLLSASLALTGLTGGVAIAQTDDAIIEDFAIRPVMRGVQLSPDGQRIAYRAAQTRLGDYIIEVRDVDDLTAEPVRLGADRMSITGFSWLSDDMLMVNFEQQVRDQVRDQNQGVYEYKRAIVRADGEGRWTEIYDDLSIVNDLVDEPDFVLVRTSRFNQDDVARIRRQGRSIADIQNRDFYRMNVNTGATRLVMNAPARFSGYIFDLDGNIRIANEYDAASRTFIYYTRRPGEDSSWEEMYRASVDDYTNRFSVLGFDPLDPNMIFVAATNGEDTASVWLFDLNSKSFVEKMLSVEGQDIESAWYSSNPDEAGQIIGFVYYNDEGRQEIAFIDGQEAALHNSIKAAFPDSDVYITSRSRDESVMTVYTTNWDDPGTNYLIRDGGLEVLGHARANLEAEDLHEQTFVTYSARDGRQIPAYLTIPDGEGPFPIVVMPHGGPWVSYRPSPFDEWSQFLASQGYLVIDPLFRGTTGLGTDHWLSSFGEWGLAMSDDMDDGITYLAEQGLGDPDRAAMFGWSFGGYSAFAASVRSPQVYQCVIPGAGVSDPIELRAAFTGNRVLRPQLEQGYDGLVTVNMAEDVSVPMLIIHGDLDQRVRINQSEQFITELDRYNKPYEFLILEGADHFDNTLGYDHRMSMYQTMARYLREDCGPGGL